jgi:ketosteroid isomerase-like protein
MRALAILLVVPTLACAAARPCVPSAAAERPNVPSAAAAEREIVDMWQVWDDAEVHHDVATLDKIFDDHFVFTFEGESPVDKATVLKSVLASNNAAHATPSEHHITIDGDVAIRTGVDTIDVVVDGKPVKHSHRYTTTFVYRDGRWRALAVHMAEIPPATLARESARPWR